MVRSWQCHCSQTLPPIQSTDLHQGSQSSDYFQFHSAQSSDYFQFPFSGTKSDRCICLAVPDNFLVVGVFAEDVKKLEVTIGPLIT